MTIYKLINDNLPTLIKLVRNKIIADATVVNHLMIYEKFYQLKGNKQERYNQLAGEFKLHPETVSRIIRKLNANAK